MMGLFKYLYRDSGAQPAIASCETVVLTVYVVSWSVQKFLFVTSKPYTDQMTSLRISNENWQIAVFRNLCMASSLHG